jgi:hypothetical protein
VLAGLRRLVDPEVDRVMAECSHLPNLQELKNFRLSLAWKEPPPKHKLSQPIAGQSHFDLALHRAAEWRLRLFCALTGSEASTELHEKRLRAQLRVAEDQELPDAYLADPDQPLPTLDDLFLEGGATSVPAVSTLPGLQNISRNRDFERLAATMDTLIAVIDFCRALRPPRSKSTSSETAEVRVGPSREFCALCWRPTERFALLAQRKSAAALAADLAKARKKGAASANYCHYHNPGAKSSRYPAHKKLQGEFKAEVALLASRLPRKPGHFTRMRVPEHMGSVRLVLEPMSAHEEDVRRAAFAMVYLRLRGRPEQIWIRHKEGMSTKEIAIRHGITPCAVRKSLKSTENKMDIAQRIARSIGDAQMSPRPPRRAAASAAKLKSDQAC